MSLLPYLYLGLESLILFIVSGRRFGSLGFFAFLFAWLMLVGLTGLASVLAPVSKLLFLIGIGTALLLLTASLTSAAKFPIRLQKISSKFLTGFMVLSLSTYIPFGTIEWIARAMTDSGHWNYFQPLQVVAANHEDWRLFHVTTNQGVEADPVLFWQPRAFRPYTHQRMRGPTAIIPKPPGLYRVMTYGDSNTEGPPEGGAWAERLGNLLKQKGLKNHPQVELINAGVTGYSSYQGLQRFKQQVETFQPDLILVSFGWNDASPAMGKTDKEFLPPNATVANLLRNLYRFRFFWC